MRYFRCGHVIRLRQRLIGSIDEVWEFGELNPMDWEAMANRNRKRWAFTFIFAHSTAHMVFWASRIPIRISTHSTYTYKTSLLALMHGTNCACTNACDFRTGLVSPRHSLLGPFHNEADNSSRYRGFSIKLILLSLSQCNFRINCLAHHSCFFFSYWGQLP